ncbi:MAG: DUF167 domain-containing protein [Chlamydiia bacterium]
MDSFKIKLQLKVIANSTRSEIKRDTSSSIKVYLRSPREKGRANEELYSLFKTTFKPIKIGIEILQGELNPKKTIELTFPKLSDYHLFLEKLATLN